MMTEKSNVYYSRRGFLRVVGGALAVSSLGCQSIETAGRIAGKTKSGKTNVVLILADDIGYECFGCYGSDMYNTPNIDALAAKGTRFTHCYAQPLCTPSRVKLMTGQSNIRNYVDFGVMDPMEKTFGHAMQCHGYKTCVAGKWQLYGAEHHGSEVWGKGILPAEAGFDQWCLWQVDKKGDRYWQPLLDVNGTNTQYDNKTYGPDICTEFISKFITENKDDPFFVYYPMILVHDPFDPTPDSSDRQCRDESQNFRDMVAYMDKLVGKIVTTLKEAGVLENTLILFVGDNGTNGKIESRLGTRMIKGGKGTTTDAGTRVPLVASLGQTHAGIVCDDLVDLSDFVPTMVEATGAVFPGDGMRDGRSFLPQILGKKGVPREAIFMYYNPSPRKLPDRETRFARDQQWKLYGDGRLYDLANDVLEEHPVLAGQGGAEAAAARRKLRRVIDAMPAKPLKIAGKN